eukprot:5017698-Alexandrium_andersonii.AAC.1
MLRVQILEAWYSAAAPTKPRNTRDLPGGGFRTWILSGKRQEGGRAVSYTHLTLPTICSV